MRGGFIRVFVIISCLLLATVAGNAQWVGAYYLGTWGDSIPPATIYWPAVSTVMHHSAIPMVDGRLFWTGTGSNEIGLQHSRDLLTEAHKAGKKVLLTVGGGTEEVSRNFYSIMTGTMGGGTGLRTGYLINNVLSFMKQYGYAADQTEQYDGVDIDWEFLWSLGTPANNYSRSPIVDAYTRVVTAIRTALDTSTGWPAGSGHKMLVLSIQATADTAFLAMYDRLAASGMVDHFNVQTYCLAGPYEENMLTWHNAALYTPDRISDYKLSSVDFVMKRFLACDHFAADPSLLSVGSPFTGILWRGVDSVFEPVHLPGTSIVEIPYSRVVESVLRGGYYDSSKYVWSDSSKAAALVNLPGDKFISYEVQKSIAAKFDYVRRYQLGGIILWDIAGGYRRDLSPPELPDSMLRTVEAQRNQFKPGTMRIDTGWNLVSVPAFYYDNAAAVIFGTNRTEIRRATGINPGDGPVASSVSSGWGYWVRMQQAAAPAVFPVGGKLTQLTIPIHSGWNIIGSISFPVDTGRITLSPAGPNGRTPARLTPYSLFDRTAGLTPSPTIEPGLAYAVRFDGEGYLTLDGDAVKPVNTPHAEKPQPVVRLSTANVFGLRGNYPNPFNPSTKVLFTLAEDGHVRMIIYNILGKEVETIFDEWKTAGEHEVTVTMDGYPSGIYFCRLSDGRHTDIRKIILAR